MEGFYVRLYEKRHEYTRTRMVQLAPYLVADSVESYRTDYIDGDSVEAVFDPAELDEGLAFRQSIPADLMALLRGWTLGFCPLNSIEREVSDLIDARVSNGVQRTAAVVTAEDAVAMLEPGDILIDCAGSKSLLRDHLTTCSGEVDGGANTLKVRRCRLALWVRRRRPLLGSPAWRAFAPGRSRRRCPCRHPVPAPSRIRPHRGRR